MFDTPLSEPAAGSDCDDQQALLRGRHGSDFHVFFFNDTAAHDIYTLSLHDALPIWKLFDIFENAQRIRNITQREVSVERFRTRSEEHTSELQSLAYLVCRLLLEKKKKIATRSARQSRTRNTG